MYLSKVPRALTHRQVMTAFPAVDADSPRADWAVLFRVENESTIVQSLIQPNWSKVPGAASAAVKEYNPKPALAEGVSFRFCLTLTPVKQASDGRRTAICPIEWLTARAERLGALFNIQAVSQLALVRDNTKGKPIAVPSQTVGGTLTITDPELFHQSLIKGVGRGKAYGQGLLSIATL